MENSTTIKVFNPVCPSCGSNDAHHETHDSHAVYDVDFDASPGVPVKIMVIELTCRECEYEWTYGEPI